VKVKRHTLKSGFKTREIPMIFREQTIRESEMGKNIVIKAANKARNLRRED